MEYNVADIVAEARTALNENVSSTALVTAGDVDTLALNEIIRSKIEDAARMVILAAPVERLDGGKVFGGSVGWDMRKGYGSGHVLLPDDFLRLLVFQMSDWSRPVNSVITTSDPRYAMQRSRFAGVRGNPEKPVVALVRQPAGLVLEFYSCTQGEDVYIKMARYIPVPKIEAINNEDVIDLPPMLKRSVVYESARLAALATGDTEQAKNLEAIAAEQIGTAEKQ